MAKVYIPDDWDGLTYECVGVQWPFSIRWISILQGMLSYPSRGRFWDERSGTITDAQAIGHEIIARNLPISQGGFYMSCDTLQELLEQIVTGGVGGCGCGTGGAPSEDPPPIDETQPSPPEGFPDVPTYEQYKCDVAAFITDGLQSDIQWLATLDGPTLAALIVSVIAVAFVLPIPGSRVAAVLAIIAVIGGYGIAILDDIDDAITTAYDDLLCALYDADTAVEARTDFESVLSDAIDVETSDTAARFMLKDFASWMVSDYLYNALFVNNPGFATGLADCSGCGIPAWWDCASGNVIDNTADWVDVEATVFGDGNYVTAIGMNASESFSWSLQAGSLTAPSVWASIAREQDVTFCGTGGGGGWDDEWFDFTNFGTYTNMGTLQHRSSTAFTMRYTKL